MNNTGTPKSHIKLYIHDTDTLIEDWGVNQFPDEQVQPWIKGIETFKNITIDVRIVNSAVLDVLLQLGTLLSTSLVRVNIKYMYGSRCDKDSYGEKADTVLVANTNSHTQALIERVCLYADIHVLSPHGETTFTEDFWYPPVLQSTVGQLGIFPDKSARARNKLKVGGALVCDKVRDQGNGDITYFELKDVDNILLEHQHGKPFTGLWVIDDLCDGGGTFIKVAEAINKSCLKDVPLNLLITHGVFSNGAVQRLLGAGYKHIYCTNSYRDMEVLQEMHKGQLTVTKVF